MEITIGCFTTISRYALTASSILPSESMALTKCKASSTLLDSRNAYNKTACVRGTTLEEQSVWIMLKKKLIHLWHDIIIQFTNGFQNLVKSYVTRVISLAPSTWVWGILKVGMSIVRQRWKSATLRVEQLREFSIFEKTLKASRYWSVLNKGKACLR